MSRALLNDPALSTKIAKDFVPFAGAIELLQPSRYGHEPSVASKWFMPLAKTSMARFGPKGFFEQFKSYQGFYVCDADGRALAYKVVWKLKPAQVIAWLDAAIADHAKLPAPTRAIPPPARAELPQAPKSVSVLRVHSRVHPVPDGCHASNKGVGRDHFWLFAAEVKAIAAAADTVGKRAPLPEHVRARLVRFGLLDHVRNVGPAFGEKDVRTARFHVTRLADDASGKRFRLDGEYDSERDDPEQGWKGKSGIKGTLAGTFTISGTRVVACRLHGKATAWGMRDTQSPEGRYPLVFALVMDQGRFARRIPPIWRSISPMWTPVYDRPTIAAR